MQLTTDLYKFNTSDGLLNSCLDKNLFVVFNEDKISLGTKQGFNYFNQDIHFDNKNLEVSS